MSRHAWKSSPISDTRSFVQSAEAHQLVIQSNPSPQNEIASLALAPISLSSSVLRMLVADRYGYGKGTGCAAALLDAGALRLACTGGHRGCCRASLLLRSRPRASGGHECRTSSSGQKTCQPFQCRVNNVTYSENAQCCTGTCGGNNLCQEREVVVRDVPVVVSGLWEGLACARL